MAQFADGKIEVYLGPRELDAPDVVIFTAACAVGLGGCSETPKPAIHAALSVPTSAAYPTTAVVLPQLVELLRSAAG